MMAKQNRFGLGGCIFAVTLVLTACILLVANGMFVSLFYVTVKQLAMPWLRDEKYAEGLARGVMFLGPVLILIFQWWLWDKFVDWVAAGRRTSKRRAAR